VANSLCRRVTEARHKLTQSPEPRRQNQNPPQQGLPNHGPHNRHWGLRLHRHRLLGPTEEADRIGQMLKGCEVLDRVIAGGWLVMQKRVPIPWLEPQRPLGRQANRVMWQDQSPLHSATQAFLLLGR